MKLNILMLMPMIQVIIINHKVNYSNFLKLVLKIQLKMIHKMYHNFIYLVYMLIILQKMTFLKV